MTVVFTVYGRLAGKGSRTVGLTKQGRMYTRPAGKYEKPWTRAVEEIAAWRKLQGPVPAPPYCVYMDFYFAKPKRPKHPYPTSIDVDKLERATLDGLVDGGLLVDDRHVTEVHSRKLWAPTREGECCQITVCQPGTSMVRAA